MVRQSASEAGDILGEVPVGLERGVSQRSETTVGADGEGGASKRDTM